MQESSTGQSRQVFGFFLQAKVVADVETFEEKKLKLQKAMGENLNDIAEDATGEQRRQNLLS